MPNSNPDGLRAINAAPVLARMLEQERMDMTVIPSSSLPTKGGPAYYDQIAKLVNARFNSGNDRDWVVVYSAEIECFMAVRRGYAHRRHVVAANI